MEKIIHYCWFGDKPISKLAKKCINSWKKYLPDYEIKFWNETNIDISECPFIKEAYKNKKWAFVADYVRCKALKEYGGIYFDTDIEIIKDISFLFNDETNSFLGMEDSGYVAVGVWYEKNKDAFLPTKLLEEYKKIKTFDLSNMRELTIPKMISKVLNKCGFKNSFNDIQKLEQGIFIYPREFFYPYSYDWQEKIITPNTCMIHYYDASWLPLRNKAELYLLRKFGKKTTYRIINFARFTKRNLKRIIKLFIYPFIIYNRNKNKKANRDKGYELRIKLAKQYINKYRKKEYITFYNSEWKGVTSSTKELFQNLIPLQEIYTKKDAKLIAKEISKTEINQVIFSSFATGWYNIAKYLKKYRKNNIKIKTFWHGSHSQILDTYGWARNKEIIELHRNGIVDVMGTCKESLLNFYKHQGFNTKFITNKVEIKNGKRKTNSADNDLIKIGLYAARCTDWRKNMYSQMAAVAQIKNAVLDIVPLDETAEKFAKLLKLRVTGENRNLSREKLMKRMANNDVNLYVSFSECAPMVPLESLENGVPCIIGNTCHYFKGTELEELLIVNNETDILEIKDKIEDVVKDRNKIIKLYKEFSKENLIENRKSILEFIEM